MVAEIFLEVQFPSSVQNGGKIFLIKSNAIQTAIASLAVVKQVN